MFTIDFEALRGTVARFAGRRILVLGDLMLDRYLWGRVDRISPEAPVPVVEVERETVALGGAGNVAANLQTLGALPVLFGVVGEDGDGAHLMQALTARGIATAGVVRDPSRPTTVKTRILSKSHSFRQQLLRLDRISHSPVGALVESLLIDRVNKAAGRGYKAIVLSDYRGGVMTKGLINACRNVSERDDLLLIVDAQDRPDRFQNVTLMTPNQPDAEKMVGYSLDNPDNLERAGKELLMITGAKAILITRGAQGMVLFQQEGPVVELPVFNKSEVFDVTGAGDTVAATMALALVTGSTYVEAMALGNLAAGIVVRKPGTAVTNQSQLLQNLELLSLPES